MTWIKVRTCLKDESEVEGICKMTGLNVPAVLGSLQILWSWADTVTTDGFIKFADSESVDNRVECPGFCDALCAVGWLEVLEDGIQFPNFETHMSESAKKRSGAAKRKQTQRKKASRSGVTKVTDPCDKSVTREEKRREEKNKESNKETQPDGSSSSPVPHIEILEKLRDAWNALPAGIAPRVDKLESDSILKAWKRVCKKPDLREAFRDPEPIMAKIRGSTFLKDEFSGFRFVWLFGQKKDEWNIFKILSGVYDDGGKSKRDPSRVDSGNSLQTFLKYRREGQQEGP